MLKKFPSLKVHRNKKLFPWGTILCLQYLYFYLNLFLVFKSQLRLIDNIFMTSSSFERIIVGPFVRILL